MVYREFRLLSPAGLLIEEVEIASQRLLVRARCRAAAGRCPDCGRPSEKVHSRYERRLLDLPSQGRAVQMRVTVRRFRCAKPGCRRRIFAERLGDAVSGRSARRTSRLELIVHHLGIALDGRPAAALARRLMLPVSKDTLLRCAPACRPRPIAVTRHRHRLGVEARSALRQHLSATSSDDASSTCSPIASPSPSRSGCRATLKSASSPATAAAGTVRLRSGRHRKPCRSPTAGI